MTSRQKAATVIFLETKVFQSRWQQLDSVLHQYSPYWRFLPFYQPTPDWLDSELWRQLLQLTEAELAQLEQDEQLKQQWLAPFFPDVPHRLESSPEWPQPGQMPFWLARDIKGRKQQQIEAFVAQLPHLPLPVLEWCAGKGHLGRWLSFDQQRPVLSLEWQAELCQQGQQQADHWQLPQQFRHTDVLAVNAVNYIQPEQHAVALHACGELHQHLLRQAVLKGTRQLDVIPCCYHLIPSDSYCPMSARAAAGLLQSLSRDELKLAVQEQVTAGERVARLRHYEVWWRLSYQALYQACTGQQDYRPLASVAKHWFSGEFRAFAEMAASQHQWQIPADLDVQPFLQQGLQQQLHVRRLQLVRSLFRPLLEQYLVLDRVLFLEEQGYQVQLKRFCPAQLTPRNWWISATYSLRTD